jgi:hypothetical protein
LRGEALVIVVMAADHDIGVGVVERLEKRPNSEVVAVGAAGAEERLVSVGERAGDRMRGEIGTQPFFLGRTGFVAPDVLALAVEHDNVPRSKFVAVVTNLRVTCSGAKIIEVWGGASGTKFVVAGRRTRSGFHAPPGFVVAEEILFRAVGISEIADSHYSAVDLDEQFCGGFRTVKILAIGDVSSADEDCRLIVGRRYV